MAKVARGTEDNERAFPALGVTLRHELLYYLYPTQYRGET